MRTSDAQAASSTRGRRTMPATPPPRLLLVEDDPAQARLFEHAVAAAGISCEIRTSGDGEAAVQLLSNDAALGETMPHLVLLDLDLPPAGGLAVLDRLKSDPALRAIPVVIFSSSRSPQDRAAAYERYANGYIIKPGELGELEVLLRDLISYWAGWNQPATKAP